MAQIPLTTKARLLQDMDRSFQDLIGRVGPSSDLRPSPDGGWRLFEVLSHIAGWHLLAATRLDRLNRGEEDTPPGPPDQINARFVAERRSSNAHDLLAELETSFQALRSAVAQMPEAEFWKGGPGEEDSLAYFMASDNGPEHYREHLADLGEGRR